MQRPRDQTTRRWTVVLELSVINYFAKKTPIAVVVVVVSNFHKMANIVVATAN